MYPYNVDILMFLLGCEDITKTRKFGLKIYVHVYKDSEVSALLFPHVTHIRDVLGYHVLTRFKTQFGIMS